MSIEITITATYLAGNDSPGFRTRSWVEDWATEMRRVALAAYPGAEVEVEVTVSDNSGAGSDPHVVLTIGGKYGSDSSLEYSIASASHNLDVTSAKYWG